MKAAVAVVDEDEFIASRCFVGQRGHIKIRKKLYRLL